MKEITIHIYERGDLLDISKMKSRLNSGKWITDAKRALVISSHLRKDNVVTYHVLTDNGRCGNIEPNAQTASYIGHIDLDPLGMKEGE